MQVPLGGVLFGRGDWRRDLYLRVIGVVYWARGGRLGLEELGEVGPESRRRTSVVGGVTCFSVPRPKLAVRVRVVDPRSANGGTSHAGRMGDFCRE